MEKEDWKKFYKFKHTIQWIVIVIILLMILVLK
jgi:hypothetical protein